MLSMICFDRKTSESRILVLLNPVAGRGAGSRLRAEIEDSLRAQALDFELKATSEPGQATQLARKASGEGFGAVVAVGGDGTSNEVLNGLMEAGRASEHVAMGVLPVGTGNDFAYGAGLPLDLQGACRVLSRRQAREIDIGWIRADGHKPLYFGNGVGMGFDARANIESRKVKYLRGMPVYLVAAAKTLALYFDAPETLINIDGEELVQLSLLVSIMNGRRLGGAFFTTPTSQMEDGVFDLCLARKVGRLKMVSFLPRFMRGTHTTDAAITMTQARRVTVTCDLPWAAHVDGEIYGLGAQRFEVRILPKRLRLLC